LGDINWLWLAGIAVIVFVVVFSLCILAKCRFSMFTRHAKRKLHPAASRKKSVKKAGDLSAEAKDAAKEKAEAASKDDVLPDSKREYTLSLIDAALGVGAEGLHVSGARRQIQSFSSQDSIGKETEFYQFPQVFRIRNYSLQIRVWILI